MEDHSKILSIFLIWFSFLFLIAHGEWDEPFLKPDPDNLGGIELDTRSLKIKENVGQGSNGFALAKLGLTDRHNITIIAGGPLFFLVESDIPGGEQSWYLNVSEPFDFEKLPDPEFLVILNISGTNLPSDDSERAFSVIVEDENDNSPRVVSIVPDPIPPIPEFEDRDDPIIKINAVDDDIADNSTLDFKIQEDGEVSKYFSINSKGEVLLTNSLDYSKRTSHRLDIIISDTREPIRSVPVSATVIVQDTPNTPPEFTRPPIIRNVEENTAIGTVVTTVEARDGDYGLGWNITYELQDDDLELFKIDENDGTITIKSEIDAEDETWRDRDFSYSFKVVAKENVDEENYPGLPSNLTQTSSEVTFAIKDMNDEEPKICQEENQDTASCDANVKYTFEIFENHTTGQITLNDNHIIRVIDLDSTPSFNRFKVDFDENTDEIIKKAFSISPTIGMADEQFSILVRDVAAIDFENGDWQDSAGSPAVKQFTIVFSGINETTHIARATFQVTVKDANDNRPIFKLPDGQRQYEFSVCENTKNETILRQILVPPGSVYPNSCKDSTEGDEILIFAEDKDVTPAFGQQSIIYRWSGTTRQPPIKLGSKDGRMTMYLENANDVGFDYERFTEEIFIVEAVDLDGGEGSLAATVPVRFKILDRNDETVDLIFSEGYRKSIQENTKGTVVTGITATDVDETAKIVSSMSVINLYTKATSFSTSTKDSYELIKTNGEYDDKIESWFKLVELDGSTDNLKRFEIVVGDEIPDREGYGEREVDRVDLTVTVQDVNNETENQIVSQMVTITITDENDNPPEWQEGEKLNFSVIVLETDWGDGEDSSSDYQREIYTLRVRDNDTNPTFNFYLSNEDCEFGTSICEAILNMFEISTVTSRVGTTTLRRKKGIEIDREMREYFTGNSDILYITIVTTDENEDHKLLSKIEVTVDDRNDNTPQFSEDYTILEYSVNENVNTPEEIVRILAIDDDRPDLFGNVSYLLTDGGNSNGTEKFNISLTGGQITAIPDVYDWFDGYLYRLEVKAIDYYRPSSSSGSNTNTTYVHIRVIDKNNHPPEFRTDGGSIEQPFLIVDETVPENGLKLGAIMLQDKDDPTLDNGNFSVMIEDVQKQPHKDQDPPNLKDLFSLQLSQSENSARERELTIIATQKFEGLWGNYTIKLKASDGENSEPGQLSSEAFYFIKVNNENLKRPEFEYPEGNDTTIGISIPDQEPNEALKNVYNNETVPNIKATDEDEGSGPNGEVTYSLVSEDSTIACRGLFQINSITGMITLTRKLSDGSHANLDCEIVIRASDLASQPKYNVRVLTFRLLVNRNTPPEFPYRITTTHIAENCTERCHEDLSTPFDPATDKDIDFGNMFNDTIYYFLKGGDSDLFDIIYPNQDNNAHQLGLRAVQTTLQLKPKDGVVLDREEKESYNVSVYATNDLDDGDEVDDMTPEDVLNGNLPQWAVITVIIDDKLDTPPEFITASNGHISAGISPYKKTDEEIGLVAAIDRDCNENVHFDITSGFEISDPSLPTQTDPRRPLFELKASANSLNQQACSQQHNTQIILNFDPQPAYKGYFTFQITATDSVGMTAKVLCRIYVVASNNIVKFYFRNYLDFLQANQAVLSEIMSEVFQYKCNIDRVFSDAAASEVMVVETHFINTTSDEPIISEYIEAQQFKPAFYRRLSTLLAEKNFTLQQIGDSDPVPDSNISQIMTYVLIGGVAVLTVSLLVLSATCFYNNKSLNRQVRALTTNTFGSQQSDLNRLGMSTDAPNTNTFAVEGSNPIWTTGSDTKRMPDFDADSVGSGGSVLIGAEDEEYFQKSSKNPMIQVDDVLANYDSENDASEGRSYYNNESNDGGTYNTHNENVNSDADDSPFTSKIRQNPLMNLGEPRMSIDVDAFGDEPYQFEGNTDVGLF